MNLEEYKQLKQKINQFAKADTDTWRTRMLLDVLKDDSYRNYLENIIDAFNEPISAKEVDLKFCEIRKKNLAALEEFKTAQTIEEKYEAYIVVERYFGLLETLNEHSVFSEGIVKQLAKKYGTEYADVIQKVDNANPSRLTNFGKKGKLNEEIYNDELIQIYLVLKKWQDEQFKFIHDTFDPICGNIEDDYKKWAQDNYLNLKYNPRILYELIKIYQKNIIKIDELVFLHEAELSDKLGHVIGGKAAGLVGLKTIGAFIPETYVIPIRKTLKKAELDNLLDQKYAVRSSADVEDGKESSFAGMFDSYLNINKNDLLKYIEKVKQSVENQRVKKYVEKRNLVEPKIAVIIQEFNTPDFSGVWLGKDLASGVLEWVEGTGDKLVSGTANANTKFYDNKSENGLKVNAVELGKYFVELQTKLNSISDFEWCIINNKIIMLQYRPVTAIIKKMTEDNKISKAVSPGVYTGKVRFIEDPINDCEFEEGDVLVTWFTDPDWVPILINAGAVVTAVGGFLSHTAIIARELGIPCITSVGIEKLKEIAEHEQVTVDADNNEISFEKKSAR